MNKIPLSEIKISRERLREENGNLEELASSLLRFGQLQPIILGPGNELIAGYRRTEAARMNGWREIGYVYRDEIDEFTQREIELEENIRRKQMTWKEENDAIVLLHQIKVQTTPGWSMDQTAIVAGLGPTKARVSEHKLVNTMVKLHPEIAEAKNFSQALSWARQKVAMAERRIEVASSPEIYQKIEERLLLGDSVEVIKTIPNESFNAIITDPPFGIDYDEGIAGISSSTAYEDSEDSYIRLLSMASDLYRVTKPNGWLVWFLGISWYEAAKAVFRKAGYTVDEIPILWDRSGGRCFTNRPDRYFTRGYDIALHCIKGDPEVVLRGRSNVIRVDPVPSSDRDALVERPVELYEELINRLTIPGEVVADFFAGSGSCLAAAAKLRRNYWGCELSPDRRAVAIQKIRAYTPK